MVTLVWGGAEADLAAAGGGAIAEGYNTIQFAGVGPDFPVLNEIREMYKKQGKPEPKEMAQSAYYNRGPLVAAVHLEAIRNALKAKPGDQGALSIAGMAACYTKNRDKALKYINKLQGQRQNMAKQTCLRNNVPLD